MSDLPKYQKVSAFESHNDNDAAEAATYPPASPSNQKRVTFTVSVCAHVWPG